MVDDYLRRDLSSSDREDFEAIYLRNEARRETLATAESLWRVANEQPSKEWAKAAVPAFYETWNRWRTALVGLATLVLLSVVAYFLLDTTVTNESVQTQNAIEVPAVVAGVNRNAQSVEQTISADREADNASLPLNKTAAPAKAPKPKLPITVKSSPVFASFTLLPGATRGESEQSVKIAPSTRSINLDLLAPNDAPKHRAYSITVKTADGENVFEARNLRNLRLTIPARKLENRTYIIFLEGLNTQNTLESVAEYTFRVRR